MSGDWHKICTDEYETAEAESFGALAGRCYGKGEIPPKLTEALTEALRAAFAGAFNHGYEACIADPPAALSALSEPVRGQPRVLGYVVLTEGANGRWNDDWDGKVHVDVPAGRAALADCRRFGHSSTLAVLTEVAEPDGETT